LNGAPAAHLVNNGATATLQLSNQNAFGTLLFGDLVGGNLVDLWSGANRTLFVDGAGNVYASGTFFGDGSGLTGVGGGVATTGDTMTGSLVIGTPSSTASLYVENTSVVGHAALFTNTNAASGTDTIMITTNSNAANGSGLRVEHTGTGDSAGVFITSNIAHASSTVYAQSASNDANSTLFGGNQTGSGPMFKLMLNGNRRFFIDNSGAIYASSTMQIGSNTGAEGFDINFYGTQSGGTGDHMFWDASKSAFRAGRGVAPIWDDVNVGGYSFGAGYQVKASGLYSSAMGYNSQATGEASSAIGQTAIASGNYSSSLGYQTTTNGTGSTAVGTLNVADGSYSFVSGYKSRAAGLSSRAMGDQVVALGDYSTAIGIGATSTGQFSMALGRIAEADGLYSFALGHFVRAGAFDNTTVIGEGVDASNFLVNNTAKSFMVGFNSTVPTLFVGPASGIGTYGKVGIANPTPAFTLDVGGAIAATGTLVSTSGYMNFGSVSGSGGYGFRDNAGVIELKNSAGTWDPVATGTVGSSFVNDTGDTMTGSLVINASSATGTLDVQNSGSGRAGTFITSGATAALYVENTSGVANGMGVVAINNASVTGGGHAGSFTNTGAGNDESTIYAFHPGATATIYAENTNASGFGVYGVNTGNGVGIYGVNENDGHAGYFKSSAPAMATSTVYIESTSTSPDSALLGGDHAGTAGNLIKMGNGANPMFVVDRLGSVYASGTLYASDTLATQYVSSASIAGQTAFTATGGNANGIYINNPGTQGAPAQFIITSGGNSNPSVKASNAGPGHAGYFQTMGPSATASVYITTSSVTAGGKGLEVDHTGTGGPAALFTNSDTNNQNAVVQINTAAMLSGGRGLYVQHTGNLSSEAARFESTGNNLATSTVSIFTSSNNAAGMGLSVLQSGQGSYAGMFKTTDTGHSTATLFVTSDSDIVGGQGLVVEHTGVGGSAAILTTTDNTSSKPAVKISSNADSGSAYALQVTKYGNDAPAILAEISNNANATATVYATSNSANGNSALYGGNHSGNGKLMSLSSAGTEKFVVLNNGKIVIPDTNVAGTATIAGGTSCFTVNTGAVSGASIIMLTPAGGTDTFGGLRVTNKIAGVSFDACTLSGANAGANYPFNYLIIN
jgi:hypothetical protein